jgi:hypothetical protein
MSINALNAPHAAALSRNNVNASSQFNEILWVLEWAEWSLDLRQKIFEELGNMITRLHNPVWHAWPLPVPNEYLDNINVLNTSETIRLAVSYTAWILWNTAWLTDQDRNNYVINHLKNTVLKNADLAENTIIRLSALNRFQINLNHDELAKLAKIEKSINETLTKNVPSMINSSGRRGETTAQRIQRLDDTIWSLIKDGVLDKAPDWFEAFQAKLKPLHALDTKYHELNEARNTFYKIQNSFWDLQVLSRNQEKKLEIALNTLTWTNLEWYYAQNIENKINWINVIWLLSQIKIKDPDYQSKISSLNMRAEDFDRFFLTHFWTKVLTRVKSQFEMAKSEAFWDKAKEFNNDLAVFIWAQRERLVELCIDPMLNIDHIENAYARNRKLFVRTWNPANDAQLRNWLIVVLGRRYSTVPMATVNALADAIMAENESTNRLYYWNESALLDYVNNTEDQNFLRSVSNAWRSVQKVWEYTTPILGKFVKWTTKLLEKVSWALWTIITWTTSTVNNVVWNYNKWANADAHSFIWKALKLPFKATQLITRPIWWWTTSLDFAAKKWVWAISWGYNGINDVIKWYGIPDVEHMFDAFTAIYKHSFRHAGKGVEWYWDRRFDVLDVEQKREILMDFYNWRNQHEVQELVDAMRISADLDDSSPYIFNRDWFEDYPFKVVKKAVNDNTKTVWGKMDFLLKELDWDNVSWNNPIISRTFKKLFLNIKSKISSWIDEESILMSFKAQIAKAIWNIRNEVEAYNLEITRLEAQLTKRNEQIDNISWMVWAPVAWWVPVAWWAPAAWWINVINMSDALISDAKELSKEIALKNQELSELISLWIDKNNPAW